MQRLRRACDKHKHTGKIYIDEKVHELWLNYADERAQRLALAKTFAACEFNKTSFVKRVHKHYLLSKKTEHIVEEGWFSEDQCSKELGLTKHPSLD